MKKYLFSIVALMGLSTPAFSTVAHGPSGVVVRQTMPRVAGQGSRSTEISVNGVPFEEYRKTPARADEATTYVVTPQIEYNAAAGETPFSLQVAMPRNLDTENPDNNYVRMATYIAGGEDEDMVFPWDLAAGTYDFMFICNSPEGYKIICRDDVVVNSDMTLSVSTSEAVNHIVYNPLLSDGSVPHPWIDFEKGEEAAPGNATDMWMDNVIRHRSSLLALLIGGNVGLWDIDDEGNLSDARNMRNVWVNDTEAFSFDLITTVAQSQAGNSYIMLCADGSKAQTVTNDIKNFKSIQLNVGSYLYEPSPEEYPWIGNSGCCDYATYYKGNNESISHGGFGGVAWNDTRLNLCNWIDADGKASDSEIRPLVSRPMFADFDNSFNIISQPLMLDGDDWSLQTSLLGNAEYINYDCLGFFTEPDRAYVANSQYQVDDLGIVFGDNVPVTLFLRPRYQPTYLFVGRYGEIRTVDYANHKLSIKKDGAEVCSSWADLKAAFSEWEVDDVWKTSGEWDYEIDNADMAVDNLQGRNTCLVHLGKDASAPVPAVTRMQLRDVSGHVTDRFRTAADGKLYFSAGSWAEWSFNYEPLEEVKVEVAPYGTGRWTPFEVEEQPDKYFAKGFGAFYEGSLSQITEGAPYGWFDVRISLATAEGNTQQQVISPAFRIDDLAGIRSVGSDIQENSSVEYYNFQGIRISKPEPGMPVIERRGDSVVKTIAR